MLVVQGGLEQGLLAQAQPVCERAEEHDTLVRPGRIPALLDQLPGGPGGPGPPCGQVTAAPGGIAPPPPSAHAPPPAGAWARTNFQSGLSPASHRARGPPAATTRRRNSASAG